MRSCQENIFEEKRFKFANLKYFSKKFAFAPVAEICRREA